MLLAPIEGAVGGPIPDIIGVAMISVGVAGLALGITQGQDWGWSSIGVVASFVAAVVFLPLAVYRASRHAAPAIDLSVFESQTVVLANAATFVYAVGFFAMLLANMLFLTSVWGYSILRAGMPITPGPLVVVALSASTGRLSRRIGYCRTCRWPSSPPGERSTRRRVRSGGPRCRSPGRHRRRARRDRRCVVPPPLGVVDVRRGSVALGCKLGVPTAPTGRSGGGRAIGARRRGGGAVSTAGLTT